MKTSELYLQCSVIYVLVTTEKLHLRSYLSYFSLQQQLSEDWHLLWPVEIFRSGRKASIRRSLVCQ